MADSKLVINIDTDEAKAKLAELAEMTAKLSNTIEAATDIRRLTFAPGDTIVVRCDEVLSADRVRIMQRVVADALGIEGVNVLVLGKGMTVDVLSLGATAS